MPRQGSTALCLQEEVWSMGAELQEAFLDSGSEDAGKLEPSLSDVQLVEAFFDVEGRLEAALAAARHPASSPQVAIILITWVLGFRVGWCTDCLKFTFYPHWVVQQVVRHVVQPYCQRPMVGDMPFCRM